MRIIYMGTPDFAVPALKKLIQSKHEIIAVITQPDRAKGRGKKMLPPPVKELAIESGIDVFQPDRIKGNEEILETIKALNPDAIVVAAYGRILPKELIGIPKYGCLNIHASLLPRWRGAAPMQHAILAGDEKTGITIMQMDEGLDTGDMILQSEIPLTKDGSGLYYPTLSDELSKLGGDLILEALDLIEKGECHPKKQDESLSTYAGLIKKEDGKIDFSVHTPSEIDRMIRAYEPWPGAYSYLNGEVFKFKHGKALTTHEYLEQGGEPLPESAPYGTVLKADDTGIYIKAKDGVFCLKELQIPGKNWMDAGSYLRGHKLEAGMVLD